MDLVQSFPLSLQWVKVLNSSPVGEIQRTAWGKSSTNLITRRLNVTIFLAYLLHQVFQFLLFVHCYQLVQVFQLVQIFQSIQFYQHVQFYQQVQVYRRGLVSQEGRVVLSFDFQYFGHVVLQ